MSVRQAFGLLVIGGLFLLANALTSPGNAAPPPTEAESRRIGWEAASEFEDLAHDIYERVNDERLARGLHPLAWDRDLAVLAQGWSQRMIASGEFEHSAGSYREHPRFVGGTAENIALGQQTSTEVHIAWMRSPGHRQNILSPDLDGIGIGIVCRNDGLMWATQIFGRYEPGPTRSAVDTSEEPVVRQDQGISCTGGDTGRLFTIP
ncbi:MAG TPA: CAP domain-containing protein [Egibacteraceae bacterium]|nr:CAP domain-containing protein [Egibacteraceae bacterium]